MEKFTAIYLRVSSRSQDTRSQEADLRRWAEQNTPVRWYRDSATGTNMDRPGWQKLLADIHAGLVNRVVVWRLDRLGRTCSGLTKLFEELRERKVGLYSLKDSLDLETPAGRLMAHVLASVASYETEVRRERQQAGIVAAKAAGKRWGGSKPGRRLRVTPEAERLISQMRRNGEPIAAIARATGLSRPTVYDILAAASAPA